MAVINALPGIKASFSGGADTITCEFIPAARNGVQIECDGFTLNEAVVSVYGSMFSAMNYLTITEPKGVIVIGDGSVTGKITISGVSSGAYFVTFVPI